MTARAQVVSKDPTTGKQTTNGIWEFHYKGWKPPESNLVYHCVEARHHNLFPSYHKLELDKTHLQKMGLTAERMADGDALSFAQLILPICKPAMSVICGGRRKPYYVPMKRFTNIYAAEVKSGTAHAVLCFNCAILKSWLILMGLLAATFTLKVATRGTQNTRISTILSQ
jgi:hypothetical protein